MKKIDVVLGLAWGDEGKGKIVDWLTPNYDAVVRYGGSCNAGHTLWVDGKKYVTHHIPSGILHPEKVNIIGSGVLIEPKVFFDELADLYDVINLDNLYLSEKCHITTPYHRLMDALSEQMMGDKKIGSTLRGVSPTHSDKMLKKGLRLIDIIDFDSFVLKYQDHKYRYLKYFALNKFDYQDLKIDGLSIDEYEEQWLYAADWLSKFHNIVNTEYFINQLLNDDKNILAEGAQGFLLDVDFGTYPYVTSTNCSSGSVTTGLGVAPQLIGKVYGITKSYITRVGNGAFPTSVEGTHYAEELRKEGQEYGATTGRPRKCGWLDLPALKYAIMINGVTDLIMTKVDILNTFEKFKVCTAYNNKGDITTNVPTELDRVESINVEMKGWNCEVTQDNIPVELLDYLKVVEDNTGKKVDYISVNCDRNGIIDLNAPVKIQMAGVYGTFANDNFQNK